MPNEKADATVTVLSLDHAPFRILSIDAQGVDLSTTWSASSQSHQPQIRFSLTGLLAEHLMSNSICVRIATDDNNDEILLQLPVYARIRHEADPERTRD